MAIITELRKKGLAIESIYIGEFYCLIYCMLTELGIPIFVLDPSVHCDDVTCHKLTHIQQALHLPTSRIFSSLTFIPANEIDYVTYNTNSIDLHLSDFTVSYNKTDLKPTASACHLAVGMEFGPLVRTDVRTTIINKASSLIIKLIARAKYTDAPTLRSMKVDLLNGHSVCWTELNRIYLNIQQGVSRI